MPTVTLEKEKFKDRKINFLYRVVLTINNLLRRSHPFSNKLGFYSLTVRNEDRSHSNFSLY